MSKSPKNGGKVSEKKQSPIPASRTKQPAAATVTTRPNAAPAKTAPTTTTFEAKPIEIPRQAIEEAAYYLWLQHGGDELTNWLEAESMLQRKAMVGLK